MKSNNSKKKSASSASRCPVLLRQCKGSRIEKMGDLLWALDNSDGVFRGNRFMHMSSIFNRSLWRNVLDLSLGKLFYAVSTATIKSKDK